MHDMNTDNHYNSNNEDHVVLKRKVIRGGSWKILHILYRPVPELLNIKILLNVILV